MPIIKAGTSSRDGVLNYIASAINLNHARGRMQVDRNTVSTDGFLFNITKVCLKLVDPIMDAKFSKIHLIDPSYLLRPDSRMDLGSSPTLLNADKDALDAAVKAWTEENPSPAPANFVTEIFYLTLGAHHYGLLSSIRMYTSFVKDVGELRKEVERMKEERNRGVWNAAPDGPMKDALLKRLQVCLMQHVLNEIINLMVSLSN
jgi:ubiquitin conjugation factor E4 B